ncbi:MAG: DUF1302 family protein [Pseudomonadota bacterium]
MIRSTLAGGLLIAAMAPLVVADSISVEIPVDLSLGVGTEDGDIMQLQFESEPRLEWRLGNGGELVAAARLRLDAEDELEPDEPEFENYSSISKPITLGDAGTLELRDVYYEHRLDAGLVRLGKQQIVWGSLDGLKILDVVNPQTFREFILDDLGNSRIPLWSAYTDLTIGNWRAEFTWIPDITSHDIPEAGAWFELTAPRFRFGTPVDAGGGRLPGTTDRDADWWDDSAFGMRLSTMVGGVDISAQAYTGRDHEPLGRVSNARGLLRVERFYERREVFGAAAEASLGSVVLRGEFSYQPDRTFNTRGALGLNTVELDQTTVGVGADIDLPFNILSNVQFVLDTIADAPAALVRPDEDQILTVFLRRQFIYDTLRTEFRWYHSLTDYDDTVVLTGRYELADNTSIYLSGEWFSGSREGLFGQFNDRDRIYAGITHYF